MCSILYFKDGQKSGLTRHHIFRFLTRKEILLPSAGRRGSVPGMFLRCIRIWLSVVVLLLPPMGLSQEPLGYFVKELSIDTSQHLVPIGSRSLVEPVDGTYYSVAHAGTGLTIVAHLEKKTGASQAERLFYLETNTDRVLDRTVKEDEILRGPFGTVYVRKTCFFNRPVASNFSHVTVMVGSNKDSSRPEIPRQLSAPPQGMPPLTSLSLVRVFMNGAGYVVVSANYESSGELGSLNIGETKDGYLIPGSASTSFHVDSKDPRIDKYGIPLRIDVQQYLNTKRLILPKVAMRQELIVVNQHFGFDKLIRQDRLEDGTVVSSRYLQPSITKEEETIDSECDSRFRQQQASGLPTVE